METREDGLSHGAQHWKLMAGEARNSAEGSPKRPNPDIARARKLVLAYGWNSTSFQIVNPGIKRWFSAAGDAVTGYARCNGVRVVVGSPVCEKERLVDVTKEFEADAAAGRDRVCYFGAERRLEGVTVESEEYARFLIGAQPVWNPSAWPGTVRSNRSLRAQLNRSRNKGVEVTEWPLERATENPRLGKLLRDWLDSKGLPPMHFMVESDTLSRLENRRVFVAERAGTIEGFVILSPIVGRNGWLFEQFPHRPGAPNGTVELMIDTAIRALAEDGFDYVTLGLSPLSTRARVEQFDNPFWLRMFLFWLRKHGQRFYNFDGLDAFKAKLRPERWEPVFAVSNEPRVSFRTLYAIAGAFSGNETRKMLTGGVGRAIATELRWLGRRFRT